MLLTQWNASSERNLIAAAQWLKNGLMNAVENQSSSITNYVLVGKDKLLCLKLGLGMAKARLVFSSGARFVRSDLATLEQAWVSPLVLL